MMQYFSGLYILLYGMSTGVNGEFPGIIVFNPYMGIY